MIRTKNQLGLVALFFLGGLVLLNNPRCRAGCKTVGEHLLRLASNLLLSGRG